MCVTFARTTPDNVVCLSNCKRIKTAPPVDSIGTAMQFCEEYVSLSLLEGRKNTVSIDQNSRIRIEIEMVL